MWLLCQLLLKHCFKKPPYSSDLPLIGPTAVTTHASNKLTFDLLTLKVVSESRVTWATSVPILVILGLSVLELGPMYATDRQTDVRQSID